MEIKDIKKHYDSKKQHVGQSMTDTSNTDKPAKACFICSRTNHLAKDCYKRHKMGAMTNQTDWKTKGNNNQGRQWQSRQQI